jgi:hypothetical protein
MDILFLYLEGLVEQHVEIQRGMLICIFIFLPISLFLSGRSRTQATELF